MNQIETWDVSAPCYGYLQIDNGTKLAACSHLHRMNVMRQGGKKEGEERNYKGGRRRERIDERWQKAKSKSRDGANYECARGG